ncbi:MAG: GEVED domain-containing protein, partial [Anaerolineae bacterium]
MINNNLLHFRTRLAIVLALLALLLAQWPQTAYAAAPSYQEQATASLGSDGTSLTINKPTGTVQGDLLLAAISVDGTPNISPPDTTWTTIRERNSGSQVRLEVYYKVAGSSEPDSYRFTWSGGQQAAGAILRYSGVDTTTPINASGIGSGTSASPTAPSVTTTVTDTMVVRIYGADDDDLSTSPYPSGYTGRLNIESNSGYGTCSLGVADVVRASAGATGSAAFSLSASEEWVGVTVALAPSAATKDWGDAPDSYGTDSTNNGGERVGPNHTVVTGLQMGTAPDAEGNGVPGANADGDDNAGRDDEDGVSSFATLTDQMASQTYTVTVAVTNTIGSSANLIGWIDFDINGTFDSNEAAATTVANGTTNGSAQLVFTVPDDVTVGWTYARFRLTTDSITASDTGGSATNGEVEDYPINIGSGGQISGHVFRDYDADGANDANEPGVAGITVTAYDVTGLAVASDTTDANGDYTLAGLIQTEVYRIEFTDLPSYLQPGPCGTDSE